MWASFRLLGMEGMLLDTKFQALLSLKYKNLILHLLKYLPCVYTVSVCLRSRSTGRFSWTPKRFYIGTDLRGHFSSACHIGQEHHGNVPDACSPAFQLLEAKIHASEAHSAPHEL